MTSDAGARASGSHGAIRKAVILARGLGTRMRRPDQTALLDAQQAAVADTGLKALIPVGRPFMDYVLTSLADAGYEEACLVIGPGHQAVREYYTITAPPRRLRVFFAIQEKPLGTADAVLAAESFVAREEFLVMNSDNYYPVCVLRGLRLLGEPGLALFDRDTLLREGNISAERIRAYAYCRVSADEYLQEIIEKPDDATLRSLGADLLISMNCWRFAPAIFPVCRSTSPSPRGELELPWAVQEALADRRLRLKAMRFREGVLDLSHRADVVSVTERLRSMRADP